MEPDRRGSAETVADPPNSQAETREAILHATGCLPSPRLSGEKIRPCGGVCTRRLRYHHCASADIEDRPGRWADTTVELPPGQWRNEFTSETLDGGVIRVASVLKRFPVALVSREDQGA